MCQAISILKARIPADLFERFQLSRLVHNRGGEDEIWFDFADQTTQVLLPVIYDGQLRIVEWGNRSGKSRLPNTGWCQIESLEAGSWKYLSPKKVIIPATFGLEKGVWFTITEGCHAVLARDHAYMLTQPASHYYQVMTRHERMPVLVGQVI